MAAEQIVDRAMAGSMNDKFDGVLQAVASVPLSFWRNILIVLALIWACRSAAALFWLIFPVPEVVPPKKLAEVAVGAGGTSKSGSTSNVNIPRLVAQNMFGVPGKAPVEPVEKQPDVSDDSDIAETRLNLQLQGVLAHTNPEKAHAIIADGNNQQLYQVGDELETKRGVKLAKVYAERVVLNNRGKLESLYLYSEEDFKKSAALSQSAARPSRPSSYEDGNRRVSVSREQLPKSISEVVRFSVHREDGKMIGYRIRPGRNREMFERFGLQSNDVVTSVNGIPVDDPQQTRAVYQSLKEATEAQLEILRGEETISINLSVDG